MSEPTLYCLSYVPLRWYEDVFARLNEALRAQARPEQHATSLERIEFTVLALRSLSALDRNLFGVLARRGEFDDEILCAAIATIRREWDEACADLNAQRELRIAAQLALQKARAETYLARAELQHSDLVCSGRGFEPKEYHVNLEAADDSDDPWSPSAYRGYIAEAECFYGGRRWDWWVPRATPYHDEL